jgi:hypothetical protein
VPTPTKPTKKPSPARHGTPDKGKPGKPKPPPGPGMKGKPDAGAPRPKHKAGNPRKADGKPKRVPKVPGT